MYSKYGIMDSIAQLNLPLTVRNNRTVLNIGEDFFIYDVTKQKIPSDHLKSTYMYATFASAEKAKER